MLLLLLLTQVSGGSKREPLSIIRLRLMQMVLLLLLLPLLLLPSEPSSVQRRVLRRWRRRLRSGIGSIGIMTIAMTSHAGRQRTRSDAGQESLDIIGSGHFCSLWPESKLAQRRREGWFDRQLDAQRSALFRELKMRGREATGARKLKAKGNEQNRKRTDYSTVEAVERGKGEKRRSTEAKVEVSERRESGAKPDGGMAVRG